jgi:Ca2+-binding EF-hand superfamily protein
MSLYFTYFIIICLLYSSHAFAAFDRNNDGSIDFTEFALVMGQKEKKDLNSTLDLAFEM